MSILSKLNIFKRTSKLENELRELRENINTLEGEAILGLVETIEVLNSHIEEEKKSLILKRKGLIRLGSGVQYSSLDLVPDLDIRREMDVN